MEEKIKEIIEKGVIAEYNGKYWGKYYDGEDFGEIELTRLSNPEFCKCPEDMTYKGSCDTHKLSKAKLIRVIKVTTYYLDNGNDLTP